MLRETELRSRGAILLAPECADGWLARMQYLLTTKQTDLTLQLAETCAKNIHKLATPTCYAARPGLRFKSKRCLHEARRGARFSQVTHGSTYDRGSVHPHVSSQNTFVTETLLCQQEHSAGRDFQ